MLKKKVTGDRKKVQKMKRSSSSVASGSSGGDARMGDNGIEGLHRNREAIGRMLKRLNVTPVSLQHQPLSEHPSEGFDPSHPPRVDESVHHQDGHDNDISSNSSIAAMLDENVSLCVELQECQAVNEKQRLELKAKGEVIVRLKKRISYLESRKGITETVPTKGGLCELSEPVVVGQKELSSQSQSSSSPPPKEEKVSGPGITTVKMHALDKSRSTRGIFCICGLKFQSRQNLRSHIIWFSEEKKFPCPRGCGVSFSGASYLKTHLRVKHNVKSKFVGCRDCGQCFPTRQDLIKHRKQQHSSVPLQGDATVSAKEIPLRPPALTPSLNLTAATATTSMPATFMASAEPLADKVEPLAANLPSPEFVDGGVPTSSQLADDLIQTSAGPIKGRSHEVDRAKRHLGAYCTCGQLCANPNALHHHIWYRKFQQKLTCTICQRTYPGFSYLDKHMYGAHKMVPVRNSPLPVAHHQPAHQSLQQHKNQSELSTGNANSSTNVAQQQQEYLPLESSTPLNRQHHKIDLSKSGPGHFCLCGMYFVTRKCLVSHIRFMNNGGKFSCKICKRGRQFSNLKQHMVRMHNVSPNSVMNGCPDCGQMFHTEWEYLNHRKSAHKKPVAITKPNSKPTKTLPDAEHGFVEFVDLEPVPSTESVTPGTSSALPPAPSQLQRFFHCKCGRKFAKERTLITHIRSRSNNKPFKCESCLRRFVTHSGLKKHIRKFHKEIDYKNKFGCWQCGSGFINQSDLIYHTRLAHPQKQTPPPMSSAAATLVRPVASSSAADEISLKIISVSTLSSS